MIAYPFRNRVIYHCHMSGQFTFRELGQIWRVTHERIRQIVWKQKRRVRWAEQHKGYRK